MSKVISLLIKLRNKSMIGTLAVVFLKLLTIEIPKSVKIASNVKLEHLATGLVIHPKTEIEDNVIIYQGVTIGRADAYKPYESSQMENIIIKKGAVLCAGSKILCKRGTLVVGENTVVGANSVLLQSTGDNEIWAGVPARKIKNRFD